MRDEHVIALKRTVDEAVDFRISNERRLRGIGFQFRYSTIDAGIEQILGAIDGHARTTDPGQF